MRIDSNSEISFQTVRGSAIEPFIPEIAKLRCTVFREFPYLYVGDMNYEFAYLATYSRSKNGFIVLVRVDSRIVGVGTGVPLIDEEETLKKPFIDQGWAIQHVFYFGEFLLLPAFRGCGLGRKLFIQCESEAMNMNRFRFGALAVVDRPKNHPRRPKDYIDLDSFWADAGYAINSDLVAYFSWCDFDEDNSTAKPMVFWLREFRR